MRAWDHAEALDLARKSYRYVARVLTPDADYETIGAADRAMLEAEERGDMDGYVEALRGLCRAARDEARRAA